MRSWTVTTPGTPARSSPSGSSLERPWNSSTPSARSCPARPATRQAAGAMRQPPRGPRSATAAAGRVERQDAEDVAGVVPEPGHVVEHALGVEPDPHESGGAYTRRRGPATA